MENEQEEGSPVGEENEELGAEETQEGVVDEDMSDLPMKDQTTPIKQASPPLPAAQTSINSEQGLGLPIANKPAAEDQLKPQPPSSTNPDNRISLVSQWSTRSSITTSRRKDIYQSPKRPPRKVERVRLAEVMYHQQAMVIQNPLMPPLPCHVRPMQGKFVPCSRAAINPGPDRSRLVEEKNHYREYKTRCSYLPSEEFDPNPAAIAPFLARPNPHARPASGRRGKSLCMGWREREERLKDYRDHLLAEEIGYETLIGNLLYIDIPKGRDISRSWENFLSDDITEWGFPYYKGSKERPRMKQREPYLAHQLKEKLWKYPKTRIFHSVAED